MFLRDCKINSVSTTKTNVAAVKKKMEKKKLFNKFDTGVYKTRFFGRAKSSSCFLISGVRFL